MADLNTSTNGVLMSARQSGKTIIMQQLQGRVKRTPNSCVVKSLDGIEGIEMVPMRWIVERNYPFNVSYLNDDNAVLNFFNFHARCNRFSSRMKAEQRRLELLIEDCIDKQKSNKKTNNSFNSKKRFGGYVSTKNALIEKKKQQFITELFEIEEAHPEWLI